MPRVPHFNNPAHWRERAEEARLETAYGYRLTAPIMAVRFAPEHAPAGGHYTPSRLMGGAVWNNCQGRLPSA